MAGDAPRPTLSFLAQSTEYAAHIRNAFQDVGLAGALRALPIDRLFSPSSVRDVVRAADGFQPHLVSPEAGLRRLVADALALADGPVDACVRRIHAVLVAAARDAATRASLLTDASTLDAKGREPLRLPAFEAAVVAAATKALEGWRDDALRVARTVVDMERSYVTAAFFRHKAMDRGGGGGGGVGRRSTNRAATDSDSDDGGPGLARTAPPPPSMHASSASGDIKSGYLDKRTSDTATRASLPDAFRWQRRYFVLAEPRGMLYYFKSPDDPPNYKGAINMRECRVEDLDAEGGVKGGGQGGRYDLDGGASAAPSPLSLLFRISAKRPGGAVVKGNTHIVLRAESASDKYSWLARLRAACGGGGDAAPLPPPSPSATRAAGPLASGAARSAGHHKGVALVGSVELQPGPAQLIGIVRCVQCLDRQRAQQSLGGSLGESLVIGQQTCRMQRVKWPTLQPGCSQLEPQGLGTTCHARLQLHQQRLGALAVTVVERPFGCQHARAIVNSHTTVATRSLQRAAQQLVATHAVLQLVQATSGQQSPQHLKLVIVGKRRYLRRQSDGALCRLE